MNKTASSSEDSRSDFQVHLIQELKVLVGALPEGMAHLSIGHVPDHPEWPEPYFEIIPRNPQAASLKGAPVATFLDLTVGNSWREFYEFATGGTIVSGANWQEELRRIWIAVIAGRLPEHLTLDSQGEVIGRDSKLVLDGGELIFRNRRRAERLFTQPRSKTVTYEPYI